MHAPIPFLGGRGLFPGPLDPHPNSPTPPNPAPLSFPVKSEKSLGVLEEALGERNQGSLALETETCGCAQDLRGSCKRTQRLAQEIGDRMSTASATRATIY